MDKGWELLYLTRIWVLQGALASITYQVSTLFFLGCYLSGPTDNAQMPVWPVCLSMQLIMIGGAAEPHVLYDVHVLKKNLVRKQRKDHMTYCSTATCNSGTTVSVEQKIQDFRCILSKCSKSQSSQDKSSLSTKCPWYISL